MSPRVNVHFIDKIIILGALYCVTCRWATGNSL